MSRADKDFEVWWKCNGSDSKEIARIAFKAGIEDNKKRTRNNRKTRINDLKPGEMFRLLTGVQVYIVCKDKDQYGRKMFFNAKGNVYDRDRNSEIVRITNRDEFWAAKEL